MSNTSIKSVYLAQAIDLSDAKSRGKAADVKSNLLSMEVVTFDPSKAYQLSNTVLLHPEESGQGEFIFGVNLFALLNADVRVFVYTGAASWGMPIELYMTVKEGLPFVFLDFTDSQDTPVYLREMLNLAGAFIPTDNGTDFISMLCHRLSPESKEHLRVWATPMEG